MVSVNYQSVTHSLTTLFEIKAKVKSFVYLPALKVWGGGGGNIASLILSVATTWRQVVCLTPQLLFGW